MKELMFEILKVGKWTSSNGKTHEFTEKDLDLIASQYNPAHEEAPITLGHPWLGNEPAYGWITKVFRVGNVLYAKAKDLSDDFVQMLKEKKYKKRSIGLDRNFNLKHIAFLGAVNPAVKGLSDVFFSDAPDAFEFTSDETCIYSDENELSAPDLQNTYSAPSSNNVIPEEYPLQDVIPPITDSSGDDDSLQNSVDLLNPSDLQNAESVKNEDVDVSTQYLSLSDKQINLIFDKISSLLNSFHSNSNNSSADSQSSPDEKELTFSYHLIDEFLTLCEQKIQSGFGFTFVRSHFTNILSYLASLNLLSSEHFSNLISLFKTFLNSFPDNMNFNLPEPYSDFNSNDFKDVNVDKDSYLLHKKISTLMKKDNLSYQEAFEKLIKE